ncbi:MAG TPA: DUF3048 domain-containing protein, partial [Candidatus Saccharimonadales bacterium]|nr:DUF3048 domain-containing protein [Candidatus Saccharimonadales bacterium]
PQRRREPVTAPEPKINYDQNNGATAAPVDDMAVTGDSTNEPVRASAWTGPATVTEPMSRDPQHTGSERASQPGGKKRWSGLHWPPSKKELLIGIPVLVILLAAGGAALWIKTHTAVPVPPQPKVVHKTVIKKPVVITSKLTGLPVPDDSVNQRPVTGVMIENSPDARPQSGLDQAGVVFEAIAEGGITRFLALYQDSAPDYLGPVRSVRPYYLQWCMGFDCSLAHVGGSPEGLQDVKAWHAKDLDQFFNAGAYHRISSRYAPHNMYTSMDQLNQVEKNKGYGASNYTGFPRKADQPINAPPSAKTPKINEPVRTAASKIDLNISGYYYNVHYDYDATTNSYKRFEGGAPHVALHKDGSKVQITPKVVVAMVMQYGLEADDHHSQYNVVGSGKAYVFQDGTVTTGTWAKADTTSPLTFADSNGKPIAFDAGQTWLTAVSGDNQVVYK